jgi:hypothetical protein
MPAAEEPPRVRGLPAIAEAREARKQMRWPSPKFWAWAGIILAAGAILQWKWSQGEVESGRQALLARQRAMAVELGPRWTPLRDKVEAWTLELARDAGSELVDREVLDKWDFRDKPGLYLRLRVEDAVDVAAIRKGAKNSLRDAFTSCLTRAANALPFSGKECRRTRDCPTGEHCNETDHCSRPAQPYNLRVGYRTMNVLSDEWLRDAQEANTELRLRLLKESFEDTVRDDVPVAADLLTRAQYFLLVLDETPPELKIGEGANAGEAVQAVEHFARVGLWRLSDGKAVLRVRREAGGKLLGAQPDADPEVLEARQRQANSCALALAVRQAMGDGSAAAVPEAPEGAAAP